jgi:hypothetical protein
MVANLLIYASATVGLLTIIDMILSEKHKKSIADLTTTVWNRLDDLSRKFNLRRVLLSFVKSFFNVPKTNAHWVLFATVPGVWTASGGE